MGGGSMNRPEELTIDAEYPIVECPRCGAKQEDMDGFGFVYCDHCGHCTHPVATYCDESEPWFCELCGAAVNVFVEEP